MCWIPCWHLPLDMSGPGSMPHTPTTHYSSSWMSLCENLSSQFELQVFDKLTSSDESINISTDLKSNLPWFSLKYKTKKIYSHVLIVNYSGQLIQNRLKFISFPSVTFEMRAFPVEDHNSNSKHINVLEISIQKFCINFFSNFWSKQYK